MNSRRLPCDHPSIYSTYGYHADAQNLIICLNRYWQMGMGIARLFPSSVRNNVKYGLAALQRSLDLTKEYNLPYCEQASLEMQRISGHNPWRVAVSLDGSYLYVENSTDQKMRSAYAQSKALRECIESKHNITERQHGALLANCVIPGLRKQHGISLKRWEQKFALEKIQDRRFGPEPDAVGTGLLGEYTHMDILSPKHDTAVKWGNKIPNRTTLIHICLACSEDMPKFCEENERGLFILDELNPAALRKIV
jgi:hypothetical protein